MIKLREYQRETHDSMQLFYERGMNRQLVRIFTGGGKGFIPEQPIATPRGFIPIKEISVGDSVFGKNGKPTTVTGVFPQQRQEIFKVTFSDDTFVHTDGPHLWKVRYSRTPKTWMVKSTDELMAGGLHYNNGRARWYIPLADPIEYPDADLPLDPYLMGAFLGDGSLRPGGSVMISSADEEIIDHFRAKFIVNYQGQYDYSIIGEKNGSRSTLINVFRDLDLYGKLSIDKHIPEIYLRGSVEQRVALLQGLMDTDGYVSRAGNAVNYSTSSERLARDVAELIRSLGGYTAIRRKKTTHNDSFTLNAFINNLNPFRLERKRKRWHSKRWSKSKAIVSIESAGESETICISVAAEDRLFVASDYIVTHNTGGVAVILPETFPDLAKHGLIFLSHRREILMAAYLKFKEQYRGKAWCGIEMGELHATGQEDYLFVSVDSLGRMDSERIRKYKERDFGIIIADEGHHVTRDGVWDNILNFFGVGSDPSQFRRLPDGSKPLSVFMTATPHRNDGKSLDPFLDVVAADYDIKYGMREGWLTGIVPYYAYPEDYEWKDMPAENRVDFLAKAWQEYGNDMRTLIFAKNIEESEMLAATLNRHEIAVAGHVDYKTPDETRTDIIDRFALPYGDPNAIDVLTNRLIASEGYDNPLIQCIVDNAPTESQSLYIQKIGRGLRPSFDAKIDSWDTAEERKEAIRLSQKPSLVYVTTFPVKHGLDMAAAIFGLPKGAAPHGIELSTIIDVLEYEEKTIPEAPTRAIEGIESMKVALKRQDIWTQTVYNEPLRSLTPLRWVRRGDDWAALRLPSNPFSKAVVDQTPTIIYWKPAGDKGYQMTLVREGGWIKSKGHAVGAAVRPINHFVPTLDRAIKASDEWLRHNANRTYAAMQRHDDTPASEAQIKYLKTNKVAAKWENLTSETAEILKDDLRIRTKLTETGLMG